MHVEFSQPLISLVEYLGAYSLVALASIYSDLMAPPAPPQWQVLGYELTVGVSLLFLTSFMTCLL